MADQIYFTALTGLVSGHIDMRKGKIRAAIVHQYRFRGHHRNLSDVVQAGGKILSVSEPIDDEAFADGEGTRLNAIFSEVLAKQQIGGVLLFQSARLKSEPDLPQDRQRLITYCADESIAQIDGGA